jgi:hypothetical protein
VDPNDHRKPISGPFLRLIDVQLQAPLAGPSILDVPRNINILRWVRFSLLRMDDRPGAHQHKGKYKSHHGAFPFTSLHLLACGFWRLSVSNGPVTDLMVSSFKPVDKRKYEERDGRARLAMFAASRTIEFGSAQNMMTRAFSQRG